MYDHHLVINPYNYAGSKWILWTLSSMQKLFKGNVYTFHFFFFKDGHTVYPINRHIASKLWHAEAVEPMMSYFKRDHQLLACTWAMMVNKLM